MDNHTSLEKHVEDHLKQALEADNSETKDFHIRSALQFSECQKDAKQVEHAQNN